MTLTDVTSKVNAVGVRSSCIDNCLFVESPTGQIEIPVIYPTFRRDLIVILTPEDIEELDRWLEER